MATIFKLPEAILHLIFEHLDIKALESATLTTKAWSTLVTPHRHRHLTFDLSYKDVTRVISLVRRLDARSLLEHVRHIAILDTAERRSEAEKELQSLLVKVMPRLTGLKNVHWDVSGKSERLDDGFQLPDLPLSVALKVTSLREMHAHRAMALWFNTRHLPHLRSLKIQYSRKRAPWSGLLEAALLKCSSLRTLSIIVGDPSSSAADHSAAHEGTGLHWSAAEAERLPALEVLELYDSGVSEESYETWATNGDWMRLKRLKVGDDGLVRRLIGRTPRLEALEVGAVASLKEFLGECEDVRELRITGLASRAGEEIPGLQRILELPFASRLQLLELRLPWEDIASGKLDFDFVSLVSLTPKVRELTVSLGMEQLPTASSNSSWLDICAATVSQLPDLTRFEAIIPRMINKENTESSSGIVTLASIEDLWTLITSRGKRLQHLQLVASMAGEEPRPCAMPSNCETLRYTTTLAAKDWDAEKGKHTTACSELREAEAAMLRGDLIYFGDAVGYIGARKIIDDMTALAENGVIGPKKKPRPMPVWLTPEEEQDKREGPPGWRRRAKRATISGIAGFFGDFRSPFSEYPGRTRQEKAMAREVGFGGRPGWSKSSFATRVVWRR